MVLPENIITLKVNDALHATFCCPKCEKAKRINVGPFKGVKKVITLRCTCLELFQIKLLFPSYVPEIANIEGRYVNETGGVSQGPIVLTSITLSAITFTSQRRHNIKKGQKIKVEYRPTSPPFKKVIKRLLVKLVRGDHVEGQILK